MINSVSIEQEIKKSYLEYSLSVIIGRAIPDVRDGLKPVHRRILFAMHELGNTHNRAHKKSARVVGDVIGKYHPHGDSAVYDALVRMAQTFSMRDLLVDGQGNFGSIDGDAAAAMRYTEVRMSRLAGEFLADIEKETVDFRPNYDNTMQEPTVLPAKAPNLLLNGSTGIAVGMATNIPPHNLAELADGALLLLKKPDCDVDDLMKRIKGPDFPTGAFLYAGNGLREAYATGRGSVRIRGRAEVEDKKKGLQSIVISEIPYSLNKSTLVEKIAALVNERRIEGVSDLRDESDRNGIRIVIDLKRGIIPDIILNALYKFTPLETSFGINMLAVVGARPQLLTLKKALSYFLEHRREVILRRSRYDLDKAEHRAHILEGLRIALDNIDKVIELIRASAARAEAKEKLMVAFELSEIQCDAILDMRLHRLTGLERDKIQEEYAELLKSIEYFKSILEQDSVLKEVIRQELTELKKTYATPRRTEILQAHPEDIEMEDLVPDDEVVITISRRGYVKRTALDSYQQQRRGGKGIAGVHTSEDDFVHDVFATSNLQHLLMFTNRGKMYLLRVYQVPEGGRTAKGMHMANLLPLEKDEWVVAALTLRDFTADRSLLFVTKKGMVKRSALEAYRNCRRSGLIAVGVRPGDELLRVKDVEARDELVLTTELGYAIRFDCGDVRTMGRSASGVRGILLRSDDNVASMVVAPPGERSEILTISNFGYGKRTVLGQYRSQGRGGKGIINMRVTPKTGRVIGAVMVNAQDEMILLTSGNKIIRISVGEISLVGRATQGVRLVRLDETGHVLGFDLVRDNGV